MPDAGGRERTALVGERVTLSVKLATGAADVAISTRCYAEALAAWASQRRGEAP